MADERRALTRHTLMLDQRETLSMTGIVDVESFDENMVAAETEKGLLIIKGDNLHVNRLNLDSGELDIEGNITNIGYEDNHGGYAVKKGSLFGKIFK